MPSTLTYFIVRLGNGLLAIATLAVLSRLLSTSEYGVYALYMSAGAVLSSIFFQWLEFAIARFYPSYLDNPKKIMATVTRGFWLATALVAFFCIAAFFMHEILRIEPLMIGILFFLIVGLGRYTLTLQIINSQNSPIQYGVLSWSKSLISLIAAIVLINHGMSERGALFGFVAGLMLAVMVIKSENRISWPFGSLGGQFSVEMFRYGLPLSLNIISSSMVDVADRVMIGGLLGVTFVAPYALAYDFVQFSVGPFMNVFILTTFPSIVRFFDNNDYESTDKHLKTLGNNLLIFGLPLVFILCVLCEDISIFMFGIKYQQEVTILLPWLAIAIFIGVFKSYFLDLVFQLHHATKYQVYIAVLMAIVNIVLNLVLLPIYGVIAAAWSILAAFSLGAIVSWVIGRQLYILPNLSDVFFKMIFSSGIIFFAMYLMTALNGFIWMLLKLILIFILYVVMAFTLDMLGCRHFIRKAFCNIREAFLK